MASLRYRVLKLKVMLYTFGIFMVFIWIFSPFVDVDKNNICSKVELEKQMDTKMKLQHSTTYADKRSPTKLQ